MRTVQGFFEVVVQSGLAEATVFNATVETAVITQHRRNLVNET